MENQWKLVAQAFQQEKQRVQHQREVFRAKCNESNSTELRSARLKVKTGLHVPKPLPIKKEMVTRVRQNMLLPPSKNTSLLSYIKNK